MKLTSVLVFFCYLFYASSIPDTRHPYDEVVIVGSDSSDIKPEDFHYCVVELGPIYHQDCKTACHNEGGKIPCSFPVSDLMINGCLVRYDGSRVVHERLITGASYFHKFNRDSCFCIDPVYKIYFVDNNLKLKNEINSFKRQLEMFENVLKLAGRQILNRKDVSGFHLLYQDTINANTSLYTMERQMKNSELSKEKMLNWILKTRKDFSKINFTVIPQPPNANWTTNLQTFQNTVFSTSLNISLNVLIYYFENYDPSITFHGCSLSDENAKIPPPAASDSSEDVRKIEENKEIERMRIQLEILKMEQRENERKENERKGMGTGTDSSKPDSSSTSHSETTPPAKGIGNVIRPSFDFLALLLSLIALAAGIMA